MVELYIPQIDDLWFRKLIMSDEATMSYNHAWGGTIDFPESNWADWYDRWIGKNDDSKFYRYLINEKSEFVGEIAYHFTGKEYIANVIVYAKYRNRGYGAEGLRLLCEEAKKHEIEALYDDIAIDNPSIKMFLGMGFIEEYRTKEIIMLKKMMV